MEENRARIAVTLSQFTVPLLSRIYNDFGGDVVMAIVLGEIAHRNVLQWLADPTNPENALMDPEWRQVVMRPCNSLSISEACQLPRETVRRKVVSLIERGLVARSPEGYLFVTRTVGDTFEDTTVEMVEALLATARQLEALLDRRKASPDPVKLQPRLHVKSPREAVRSPRYR